MIYQLPVFLKQRFGEIEGKIPYVTGLIKKISYNNKISLTEGKYFTTSLVDKLRTKIFDRN